MPLAVLLIFVVAAVVLATFIHNAWPEWALHRLEQKLGFDPMPRHEWTNWERRLANVQEELDQRSGQICFAIHNLALKALNPDYPACPLLPEVCEKATKLMSVAASPEVTIQLVSLLCAIKDVEIYTEYEALLQRMRELQRDLLRLKSIREHLSAQGRLSTAS